MGCCLRIKFILCCLFGLLWLPKTVFSEDLTEQSVVDLFLQNNLPLLAGKMQIALSQAQVLVAKQWTNPSLSLSVSGLGDTKSWDGGNSYWDRPYNNNLSISQLIETAGKRQLRIEGAEIGEQAQNLLFVDLLRSLKRDLLTAYYLVVMNQQRVAIYDEILQQLNEVSSANFLRFKAGDISQSEFSRIELAVLKAKTDVEQAHLDLDVSRQQLAEILAYRLSPDHLKVLSKFPSYHLPQSPAPKLISKALDDRPDIQAARLTIEQQQKQLDYAQVQKIPDVVVGVQYVHDPSATLRDSAGVGIGMTIPLWHQYQGEVEQARVNKRLSEVALNQLEQQIKTQVNQAYSQFQQKDRVLVRFNKEVIGRAKQVRESSVFAYQQGAISLLELLDAEGNYRNTMLDYTQALYDQTIARLNLNYAIGEEGNN